MKNYKLLFIIDKLEFKYFEFNKLVTSFWLIKECNERGWDVFITTRDELFLKGNIANAITYKTKNISTAQGTDLIREAGNPLELNEFDMIFFRPDPPVDVDYINSTYILDFVDKSKTLILNDPAGIRSANEKMYINNFLSVIPTNIVTSNADMIVDFVNEHTEAVIKPLNKCFSSGVFYLNKNDKNLHTIIETATNKGTTVVMVQEYLEKIKYGDKRLIVICGEVFDETVVKKSGANDFKFNTHSDEYFQKGVVTDADRKLCSTIAPKLIKDGLLIVGLDVIDGKMIEINVTSPCFFIKEINELFNTRLEVKLVNYFENLLIKQKRAVSQMATL